MIIGYFVDEKRGRRQSLVGGQDLSPGLLRITSAGESVGVVIVLLGNNVIADYCEAGPVGCRKRNSYRGNDIG